MGSISAPMIQKMGRKNPMMNIIQWPFASVVNANMKNRITQIRLGRLQIPTTYLLLFAVTRR